MLQLKFCPFVKSIDFFYWKHGSSKFEFYEKPHRDGRQLIEHAIVELFYENQTSEILKKYLEVLNVNSYETSQSSKLFSVVSSSQEIQIVDQQMNFAQWKNKDGAKRAGGVKQGGAKSKA